MSDTALSRFSLLKHHYGKGLQATASDSQRFSGVLKSVRNALAKVPKKMSSATLSKEFFELIKAIGESKSKQEEDRIIQDEVRVLKQLLQELKGGSKKMKEILVRLIYVEMLGHDASWGYVVAVQQTATSDLPQKRAGYLACSLMLSPDHEFRFMLVNQMQRDLASANVLEVCAALIAVSKLMTTEMIPAILPKVAELLSHEQSLVRKKAIMALHRFYKLEPTSIAHLLEPVKAMLRDRDPSVMGAGLCLLHDLAKADPSSQAELVDQYVSILKQITEHRLPRDFDYHRMPAPWIQIKLLQVLATLGANDKRASESMYEVLGECMKRADTGTNIGYAVVYESVKTVTSIWPDTALLDAAANAISRFVQSEAYNLKYLGVTGLAAIVRDHPRYAVQHQMAVIDCLEDPDETLKRKTLELLFRMTNPANAEAVVEKLLSFLVQAMDPFLRADLVTRICQLADRYAPSNLWFVETMIRLFTTAGDLASSEACQNLLRLIGEGVEPTDDEEEAATESATMRKRACFLLVDALRKPHPSEVLMKAAFWSLGEYGYLLSTRLTNGHKKKKDVAPEDDDVIRVEEDEENGDEDGDMELIPIEEVLNVVCDAVDQVTIVNPTTKAYGVSAISKLTAQMGVFTPRARQSLEKHSLSRNTELQQRCKEILHMVSDMSKLPELFPVDASCEDFENVEFSFLDEFSEILRAAGANEYQEHLRVVNDYDQLGLASEAASPGQASAASGSKLRFDAYEPPKLYETTISSSVANAGASSETFSADDLARMVANASMGGGASAPMQQASKPSVKAVWGPKGYMGNLPSLGGGIPQQSNSPAVSSSPSAQQVDSVQPPPMQTSQSLPYQSPDYDFGGEEAVQATLSELTPPPPLPKKPEMTEKERAAQALFGGLGGGSSTSSSKSKPTKSSVLSGRSAPAAVAQPQAKKAPSAPPPDLFSMDADLLGVGSSPSLPAPTSMHTSVAASTPSPSATDSLLDLFGSSTASGPSLTMPVTPPAQKALKPHPMDTGHFGSLWPSHAAEGRLSVRVNGAFSVFLQSFPAKVGASLVEFIPATQEAIFAGDVAPMETVLVHAKDRGNGAVDLMVRSKQPMMTDKVIKACRDVVF